MCLLTVRCGLRESEIGALRINDVDFQNHRIRICRNFVLGELTTIKTASTTGVEVQYVYMTPEVAATMRIFLVRKAMLRRGVAAEWLWGAKPVWGTSIRTAWYIVRDLAKVRCLKSHALRATFATLLVEKGMQPKELHEACRHTSLNTTMQFYVGLNRQRMVDVWNRLDAPAVLESGIAADARRPHTA